MKKLLSLTILMLLCVNVAQARKVYVSKSGSDMNKGTVEAPYLTISKAAYHAIGGDTIIISGGVYREWVSPAHTGLNEQMRVVYTAAQGEDVHIKGSEQITSWKRGKNGVWSVTLDNTFFGDFNPYAITLYGDWLHNGKSNHLGEVYLDGEALIEDPKGEKLSEEGYWSVEVNDATTTISANFGDANPNKQLAEINVRPACFYPKATGINYIVVDGLKLSQAASQWAAPTNEQWGLIGPNWSRGWVIKNCEIAHSKCVGVSLGKERASGHNLANLYNNIPYNLTGFNREIEAILKANDLGWSKENIGGHLIENNVIRDCGQAGIVGHLGCAFSTIRGNKIYNCNRTDNRITGFETGGIKLHAAIDTYIENNIIFNNVRGIWLDWQAQGTHVCGNLFFDNEENDIFMEVSHGPTLIYNNVCLSPQGVMMDAQGVALFNNLIRGTFYVRESHPRFTPYHQAHSTKVKGFYNNVGGDNQYYNNIFLGISDRQESEFEKLGLAALHEYPTLEELSKMRLGTAQRFSARLCVTSEGNLYFGEAKPCERHEANALCFPDVSVDAQLVERNGSYYLDYSVDEKLLERVKTLSVNTEMLGWTIIGQHLFEHADGSPFSLDSDLYGTPRNAAAPRVGPFESGNSAPLWPL